MKYYQLFLKGFRIFIFLFTCIFSIYSCTHNKKEICNISIYKNRIYYGISSPIAIDCSECDTKSIWLKSNTGQIEKVGNYKYSFSSLSMQKNDSVTFEVIENTNMGEKKLCEKSILIREPPRPIALFGNLQNGQIVKKKILTAHKGIGAKLDTAITNHFNITYNVRVLSFSLSTEKSDGLVVLKSDNYKLTSAQYDLIRSLKDSDSITFNNIIAKNIDGKEWELEPMTFIISE